MQQLEAFGVPVDMQRGIHALNDAHYHAHSNGCPKSVLSNGSFEVVATKN